jgi:hypothetical protein
VAVLSVSSSAPFIAFAAAPALAIAFWRNALGTASTVLLTGPRLRTTLLAPDRRGWLVAGLAGLFLALHFGTWVPSVKFTSVASATGHGGDQAGEHRLGGHQGGGRGDRGQLDRGHPGAEVQRQEDPGQHCQRPAAPVQRRELGPMPDAGEQPGAAGAEGVAPERDGQRRGRGGGHDRPGRRHPGHRHRQQPGVAGRRQHQ